MHYNISFEVTSLFFVLFIFGFSCAFYPIQSRKNKLFRIMGVVLLLTEFIDIVTAIMINRAASVPTFINMLANSLYFVGGLFLCYIFSAYTDAYFITEKGRPVLRKTKQIVLVIAQICIIVNSFNGMLFYFDENRQYVHGPGYYLLYAGIFFFILTSMIATAVNFKVMSPVHRVCMCLFYIVFLLPTILQMTVYTDTLLVLSGASLGYLVNFFFLETPDYVKLSETLSELNDVKIQLEQNNIQLQNEKARADEASKAKSIFLANMSHEIRTPINAVLGMDTMILRESKEPQIVKYARDIQSAGRNLLSLVNDILDFSKIESGKMEPVYAEYEFVQIINEVENMIRPRMDAKGLRFEVKVDESIPCRMFGDDFRLKQILTNLLTNAVKYTPKGQVVMSVERLEKQTEYGDNAGIGAANQNRTETLRFSIADTGIGIKKEDIKKLTDEFVRVDEKQNRNIEGTGLGINIVVSLLAMFDSKLEVESTYGEGSVFSFRIVQKVMNPEPIGNYRDRIEKTSVDEEHAAPFCAPHAKLLVVDDNAMNRNVFSGLVKDLQCQVDEAESGMQCMDLVQKNKYDIIFMDHLMPIMDGIETLHQMRGLGDYINADTPVVILTANAVIGARKEYLAEGFDEYLTKPVNADVLEKLIGRMISDDKKMPASKRNAEVPVGESPEDLPSIDGVDFAGALLKLKKKELLIQAVTGFSKMAKVELDALKDLYQKLQDMPEQLDAYRIKVHSMKSTAALIGANHVAGLAKYLEYAARERDLDTIDRLMPTLEKEWLKLKEAIDEAFSLGETKTEHGEVLGEETALSKNDLKQLLGFLSEAMQSLDIDRADAVMEELNQYSFQGREKELQERLVAYVMNLDKESCLVTISEWMELI